MALLSTQAPAREFTFGRTRTQPGRLLPKLFAWRSESGFGWLEGGVLAAFCAALALVLPYHELWADEGQAWLIARDNTAFQIVRYRLHYEGAPALWHLTLRLFHVLGGTYQGISYLGAAIATVGIFAWLRWSPFPLIVRVLLPFTFFLQYQYAAVARGYVYFPLLCFALCVLYAGSRQWIWFLIVAGLLANLSMQGAVFSCVVIALRLWDTYQEQRAVAGSSRPLRRQLVTTALIYGFFLGLSALTVLPAPDLNFAVNPQGSPGALHALLLKYPGEPARTLPLPAPEKYFVPDTIPPEPSFRSAPAAWLGWYAYFGSCRADGSCGPQSFLQPLTENVLGLLGQSTWPLSTSRLLACAFLVLTIVWLRAMRSLRTLLPWAMLILVGQILWVADHHAGMLFVALICGVWLARIRHPERIVKPGLERAFVLSVVLICALQIHWSWVVMRKDVKGSYDPGPETARWLLAHPRPRMACFDFLSVSIQPWFPESPFFNEPTAYWRWSNIDNVNELHQFTIASHPDVAIVPVQFLEPGLMHNDWAPLSTMTSAEEELAQKHNPLVRDLKAHGYVETHRFCGTRWSRLSSSYRDCDLIFEPDRNFVAPAADGDSQADAGSRQ